MNPLSSTKNSFAVLIPGMQVGRIELLIDDQGEVVVVVGRLVLEVGRVSILGYVQHRQVIPEQLRVLELLDMDQ